MLSVFPLRSQKCSQVVQSMKEVRRKSVFTGQGSGLSRMLSMEKRPESQLGSKIAGGRVITHEKNAPPVISEHGKDS